MPHPTRIRLGALNIDANKTSTLTLTISQKDLISLASLKVNGHNSQMLLTLPGPIFKFLATDSKKDTATGRVPVQLKTDNGFAGGLPTVLAIGTGAHIMLTVNIDTKDGLVISAQGIVTGFIPPPTNEHHQDTFSPKCILVKFKDGQVGKCRRLSLRNILPDNDSTPIARYEARVQLHSE